MKIAICTPSREMVHTGFAFDLANLVGDAVRHGHKVGVFNSPGTLIADQRMKLADEALAAGADYILWLDTDMRFPKDALSKLLKHGKDIVGANYVTRTIPVEPTAMRLKGDVWEKVPTLDSNKGLEGVDGMGFGVMLTSTAIFKKMERPWFLVGYSGVNSHFIGEDIYFCMKAGTLGFKVHVDHDLSKEVRHIGSLEFRHEHFSAIEEAA